MRIVETKVYTFDKLSDEAKDKALDIFRNRMASVYFWADEAIDSLKAFADEIGIVITDYSIDWGCAATSYVKYRGKSHSRFIKQYFTGYCMDYTLSKEWNETRDVDCAISAFLNDCESDFLSQMEDEYIIEDIYANEYEFTENGELA